MWSLCGEVWSAVPVKKGVTNLQVFILITNHPPRRTVLTRIKVTSDTKHQTTHLADSTISPLRSRCNLIKSSLEEKKHVGGFNESFKAAQVWHFLTIARQADLFTNALCTEQSTTMPTMVASFGDGKRGLEMISVGSWMC